MEHQIVLSRGVWIRRTGVGIGLAWFLFAAVVLVFAQDKDAVHHSGKPGLWEITTTTTWQKSPVPLGSPGGPPRGGLHTTTVCLTQEMIDAGALLPQSRGQCRIEDKVIKPGSVTGNYVCTGKMRGTGKLQSTLPDLEHVNNSIHFEGTMEVNAPPKPIEWTTTSTSVFKGAQCSQTPSQPAAAPSH